MLCHQQGFSYAVSSSVHAGNEMNEIVIFCFTPSIASVIPMLYVLILFISTSYEINTLS